MKISGKLPVIIALAAVIAGGVFIPGDELRWIGHAIIGLAAGAFIGMAVSYGIVLAGRVRRPASPSRFHLHRKYGIAMGFLMAAAFGYGLWMAVTQRVLLFNSIHGLGGLLALVIAFVQIFTGLYLRRRHLMAAIHHWAGYLLAGLILFQVVLGVLSSPLFAGQGEIPRYSARWLTVLDETWQPDGVIGRREYQINRALAEGNYEISYRADGSHIYIGLKVKTAGWVSVGISAGEGMDQADFAFGYISEGKVTFRDSFGVNRMRHVPDTELGGTDDIVEFGGREEGGYTVIEFKRPLFSADKYDISLTEGLHRVMWAYGLNDNEENHAAWGYLDVMVRPR